MARVFGQTDIRNLRAVLKSKVLGWYQDGFVAKLDEAFARVRGGQVFLVGANIATYPNAKGALQHEPARDRKLLLHRRQIAKLESHIRQKGKTVVALTLYFSRGWAKCELGIAEGKRQVDKRQALRERQQNRDIARQMSSRQRR